MALKFLNKKGWHTGSLRNIENVWKAEQKQQAEEKKLDELRKQIREERDRAEFRELQVQAGLVPKQERLEFLYDSGLAVGKGGSSFKSLESVPKTEPEASSSASAKQESTVPGALFEEDKPQSANDAWRKLHSDPLLMIRQREQEALARVKNNPVQMAMIRKSVEAKKGKDKDDKKQSKKHHKKKSKHRKHSSSENDSDHEDAALTAEKQSESCRKYDPDDDQKKSNRSRYEYSSEHRHLNSSEHALTEEKHRESRYRSKSDRPSNNSDEESGEADARRKKYHDNEYKDQRRSGAAEGKYDRNDNQQKSNKSHHDSKRKEYSSEQQIESQHHQRRHSNSSEKPPRNEPNNNRRRNAVKLSEEERAARLREMQMDAELHEEQRWKRLKKAADSEAQEVIRDQASSGRNFLDAAQRSVFGAEKGGSSTIEESVRRRMHYSQRNSAAESNAFRRA